MVATRKTSFKDSRDHPSLFQNYPPFYPTQKLLGGTQAYFFVSVQGAPPPLKAPEELSLVTLEASQQLKIGDSVSFSSKELEESCQAEQTIFCDFCNFCYLLLMNLQYSNGGFLARKCKKLTKLHVGKKWQFGNILGAPPVPLGGGADPQGVLQVHHGGEGSRPILEEADLQSDRPVG